MLAVPAPHRSGGSGRRPFLGLRRADTERICTASGLTWWSDPHNADRVFRRSRLVGWSVFRHRGDRGERLAWGDALFDPHHPAALPLLLRHVLAAPEHRSAELVETWLTSRPSWWSERVRALGFESRPEPQDLGFVFVPFEVDPEEDFRAALYYNMGDSDLF